MKRILFVLLITVCAVSSSFAQKYGHVNFGNLLSLMPQVESAEGNLQAYEKEQVTLGEEMLKVYQEEAQRVITSIQNGEVTPKQQRELEAKLQADQARIQQFEQQMAVNVEKKRQELLGPIIQEAKDAVSAVAKEGGYELVFDSSIFGSVLFAETTTDLLPVVKARLGIE